MSKPTLNIGLIDASWARPTPTLSAARMLYPNLPMAPHLYCLADANDELAAKAAARFGFETLTGDWRSRSMTEGRRRRRHHLAQPPALRNGAGGDRGRQARLL